MGVIFDNDSEQKDSEQKQGQNMEKRAAKLVAFFFSPFL